MRKRVFTVGSIIAILLSVALFAGGVASGNRQMVLAFVGVSVAVAFGTGFLLIRKQREAFLAQLQVLVEQVKGKPASEETLLSSTEQAKALLAWSQSLTQERAQALSRQKCLQTASAGLDCAKTTSSIVKALAKALEALPQVSAAGMLVLNKKEKEASLYSIIPPNLPLPPTLPLGDEGVPQHHYDIIRARPTLNLQSRSERNILEETFLKEGCHCSWVVPLLYKGQPLGLFAVAAKEAGKTLEKDGAIVNTLGQMLTVQLVNQRLSSEVRHDERQIVEAKHAAREEKKQQAEELKLAYSQMAQTNKMAALGQLSAGVAHELNNPIGGMLGYVQMALNKLKKEEIKQEEINVAITYLGNVEREAKRCQWIISNMLNFSRKAQDGMLRLNIKEVIDNTVSMLEYQLAERNVKLPVEMPEEGLKPINGNGNQLQQVFTNLIQNAADALLDGGEVRIIGENKQDERYSPPMDYVEVRVVDNGPGIPKENIEKIFDPFFTSKIGKSGTGLGLSITHTIITSHKGRINVESEEGRGTTFIIQLPAIREDAEGGNQT